MAELRDEKLDLWIRNSWNVLLEGRHGVGKTERVREAFERAKVRWKYFSAGSMDPWVDFIGIPKAKEQDGEEFLTLVLPQAFQRDEVEVLFLDEFNRAHPKVQNACMELIQFKSINGRKFKNLRMVWVAINPDYEEEYNVEKLDPAIRDRFTIQFEVDSLPCPIYFGKKYPHHAKAALAWWNELPVAEKRKVSPRRLEEALKVHQGMGDLHDCLPRSSNVTKLLQTLKIGPVTEKLKILFDGKLIDEARSFLAVENNFAQAKGYILDNEEWQKFFIPLLQPEKISYLISTNQKVCKLVCSNAHAEPTYTAAMYEILRANTNRKLVKEIKKHLKGTSILVPKYASLLDNTEFEEPYFNQGSSNNEWNGLVAVWKTQKMDTTPQRLALYKQIHSRMPEKLTSQQAQDTLELFGLIMDRSWDSKLEKLENLVGMVNHCIAAIHQETRLDWLEMLKVHETCLGNVLAHLEKAELHRKVMCPLTVVPGIGELILERKETQE